MADDLFHTGPIITDHAVTAVIGMVDDYGGDTAGGQADDCGSIIIRLDNDHTVQITLPRMFIIVSFGVTAAAEKSQIITAS